MRKDPRVMPADEPEQPAPSEPAVGVATWTAYVDEPEPEAAGGGGDAGGGRGRGGHVATGFADEDEDEDDGEGGAGGRRERGGDPPAPHRPRHVWPVLALDSPRALAQRLELDDGQLAWLADARGLERRVGAERLRNYRYRWLERPGGLPRLIERPKARLMESQRIVLREILDAIPPYEAAHGFRRGRSARTHAAAHAGREVVVRFDLEDFFASVGFGRVLAIYHAAGYDRRTAHVLAALSTNVVPVDEWTALAVPADSALAVRQRRMGRRLAHAHLPQGAPTSPALASLAAYGLDVRLSAYAATIGARYTRYADDLAFSGDDGVRRGVPALSRAVADIAREDGFRLNAAKTRVMPRARRQSVCSVVVNAHPNVAREEYDRLKAILHEAALDGPAAANRAGVAGFEAHVRGRVSWVASLNPARGARLHERLAAVDFGG
jgi:hypothetical protein